jgi:DEAD/DEAH box helicase domain-containing protein
MNLSKAYDEAHPGAVLLHQGETYIVSDLDLESLTANVIKEDVDYYTEARKTVDISINSEQQCKKLGEVLLTVGGVEVTEYYSKYQLKRYDKIIDSQPLALPPLNFRTTGMWFIIPDGIVNLIHDRGLDFKGGIHGLEHAMIAMTPIHAMCDR